MRIIFKFLLFAIITIPSNSVFAQSGNNVSGIVSNEKGEPLKSATVFISGSERVTPTDDNGRFNFRNVPPGAFKLSVQMLGYNPLTRNIIVKNESLNIEMRLQPKTINLNEVLIGAINGWTKNYEIFKDQFLGRSRNASQCVILNPKIINFTTKKGLLLANADDFLIIENKRLGYRIHYLLQDFGVSFTNHITLYHGEFSFEELDGTDAQKKEWAKNRAETYKGSFRHFLRSVYANNALENGFIARKLLRYGKYNRLEDLTDPDRLIVINTPVKFDTLMTAIDSSFISLKFKELYVIYDPKKAAAYQLEALQKNTIIRKEKKMIFDSDASLLRLSTDQAIIDKKGSYTDYRNFFIKGYWAEARIGDELPVDYVSPFPEIPRGNMPVNKPAFALQSWTNSMPQEKAYLHMDKPYYALGDTIWFKGYLTTTSRHQLSTLSGAVYVDLINEQNEAVKTLKLPVDSGTVAGNLILDDDIKAGSYRIRAYTQWMRNAGEDYFFNRTFTIGNPNAAEANIKDGKAPLQQIAVVNKKNKKAVIQQTDVQFFPESGNLVNGITSRIGFKAIGADGLGEVISGTITDNENNEAARINTLHAGMGNFLLKPLPGKTYTANIKLADSTVKTVALPEAINAGYVLSIYQPNKDSVLVRIQASALLQHSTVNLIVHSSGELIFSSQVAINSAMTSVWLDKNSFPSGIVQFTIFNANNEPLNERIAFIKNNDHMQLAIKGDKALYKSKEHVRLALNAKESGGTLIAANFSVAVIDQNKVPVDESAESTIFSNILLSADIKGYIEKPNYYFMTDTGEVNKALDNLMLTQGYRRFEWKSIVNTFNTKPLIVAERLDPGASTSFTLLRSEPLQKVNVLVNTANTKPTFAAERLGVTISGTVTALTHRPLPNAAVLLVSTNARVNKTTITDDNGRFKFDNLIFADSTRFAVQARDAKNTDHAIIILDSVPKMTIKAKQNLADVSIIKTILKKAEDDGYPVNLTGPHVLKQVNIKATRNKNVPQIPQQGIFSLPDEESADKIITIPDPERYPTLKIFLQTALSGVIWQADERGYTKLTTSRKMISLSQNAPEDDDNNISPILNGKPSSFEEIEALQPEDIAKILLVTKNEAMKNILRVSGTHPAGYILFITKMASARKQYNPNIVNIKPKGFNKVRQFYSPRYNQPNDATKLPDLRTTIYWNPYINTDVNGKATLDFYNADGPGTYRVVIEGINATGELGRQVYTYKVE